LQVEKAVISLEFFTTLVVAGNSSDSIKDVRDYAQWKAKRDPIFRDAFR